MMIRFTPRSRSYLYSFLLVTSVVACSKEPDASPLLPVGFTVVAKPALDYPIEVQFVNTSDSTGSSQWDFGDGRHSDEFSPAIRYDSSGSFPVRLTMTKGGISQSLTRLIDVPYRRLSVSALYVIPKGRSFDPALKVAISRVATVVQQWYSQQLDGRTYTLNRPTVDTLHSSRYGYEYGTTSIDLLNGLSQEIYRKRQARINPSDQVILVFYPVGIPGADGVGVADQQNGLTRRIGIVGSNACQSLTGTTTDEQKLGLWITAHELGHALGLLHTLTPNALMFGPIDDTGYLPDVSRPNFPACQLIPADKVILRTSPFLR